MNPIRLLVAGVTGRMGRAVLRTLVDFPAVTLTGALARPDHPDLGQDAGLLEGRDMLGVTLTDDPLPLVAGADAIVDFTTPALSVALADLAAQARIVHVIGTTGFSAEHETRFKAAARHAILVKSGNMSLGVNLLAALVRQAARALPGFDVEIVEMHHRRKVDAPSGTALLLGEAAAAGRDGAFASLRGRVRDGHTGPRPSGEIGFASLRGGTVVGEHDVVLAGPGERLVLRHVAEDRAIFARGALTAALWGQGRKPGLYGMADVIAA